jgi:hypothetical protein
MLISEDAKAVVASNLAIAKAIVYQENLKQGKEEPGTVAQAITEKWFKQFLSLLDREKA